MGKRKKEVRYYLTPEGLLECILNRTTNYNSVLAELYYYMSKINKNAILFDKGEISFVKVGIKK